MSLNYNALTAVLLMVLAATPGCASVSTSVFEPWRHKDRDQDKIKDSDDPIVPMDAVTSAGDNHVLGINTMTMSWDAHEKVTRLVVDLGSNDEREVKPHSVFPIDHKHELLLFVIDPGDIDTVIAVHNVTDPECRDSTHPDFRSTKCWADLRRGEQIPPDESLDSFNAKIPHARITFAAR